ncbi:hypothetical protein GCM10009851_40460 [Herbiconiux moechotypicola]|uniref:Uncharacterized protein n=2 Tax=Herbiconiux moechotypicola TaxID=637393 RepID=A0ABP5R773_9MICO
MIPDLFELLLRSDNLPPDGTVIVFHEASARPEYGLSTRDRQSWVPPRGTDRKALLDPLRTIDRAYRDRALMPPNVFIGIDVPNKRAWFGRSFHANPTGPFLDATTLQPIPEILTGPPARLAPKAQIFHPHHVPDLKADLSTPGDGPEEAFLLHEELMQLAVDSLDSDEPLDPLPVHLNGLWIFARPVIMHRPDGTERHVRAVWFRQGEAMWRMRAFAAGVGREPKEVGAPLSGRLPFVPVWDQSRPEQKLVAAVWALMSQGNVTESSRVRHDGTPPGAISDPADLTIVRVKAGTKHAKVYRHDDPSFSTDRPAWSVRGHWRRQPYPSLGRDDAGNVITKMKWIASYTKGDQQRPESPEKVIIVRP